MVAVILQCSVCCGTTLQRPKIGSHFVKNAILLENMLAFAAFCLADLRRLGRFAPAGAGTPARRLLS